MPQNTINPLTSEYQVFYKSSAVYLAPILP